MTNRCYVQRPFKQRNTLGRYCSNSTHISCGSIVYDAGGTTYGIRRLPNQLAFNARHPYYFSSHQCVEGNTDRRGRMGHTTKAKSTSAGGHDCRHVAFDDHVQATNYSVVPDDRTGICDAIRHVSVTDIRPLPTRNITPGSYPKTLQGTQSNHVPSAVAVPTANEHSSIIRLPPIEVFLYPRPSVSVNAIH